MKRHHIAAAFLLICRRIICLYKIRRWGYRRCNSHRYHLYPTRDYPVFSRKVATPAQIPWSKSGCPNFLGDICLSGFHGWGYRKRHYTGYPDDFRDSPVVVSRQTVR